MFGVGVRECRNRVHDQMVPDVGEVSTTVGGTDCWIGLEHSKDVWRPEVLRNCDIPPEIALDSAQKQGLVPTAHTNKFGLYQLPLWRAVMSWNPDPDQMHQNVGSLWWSNLLRPMFILQVDDDAAPIEIVSSVGHYTYHTWHLEKLEDSVYRLCFDKSKQGFCMAFTESAEKIRIYRYSICKPKRGSLLFKMGVHSPLPQFVCECSHLSFH